MHRFHTKRKIKKQDFQYEYDPFSPCKVGVRGKLQKKLKAMFSLMYTMICRDLFKSRYLNTQVSVNRFVKIKNMSI